MTDTPARGGCFRARVAEVYSDLSPADEEAIEEIAHLLDLLDVLRAEVGDGPLTEIRQGGRRMRPEVTELRLTRLALDRLLRRFPAVEDDPT